MSSTTEKTYGRKNRKRMYVIPQELLLEVQNHPLAHSLYFTDIGCFEGTADHYRERHEGSDQVILIYCYQGTGYCILNRKKSLIPKDTLLFIPRNTPHIYASSENDPWSILWIHIEGSDINSYFHPQDNEISLIPISAEKQQRIKLEYEGIFEVLDRGFSRESLLFSCQVIRHILGLFFLSSSTSRLSLKESGFSLSESIDFMLSHIDSDLTLIQLAKHAGLSQAHYSALFKKNTNSSPIQYFLGLKIQKACIHLDDRNSTIKEISEQLGFGDPFYFSRLFHKVMGLSPTEYRKKQRG